MTNEFKSNWTTDNNGVPLNDSEVQRYISVTPSDNQLSLAKDPYYCFIHFGMNTATGREWGSGKETPADFTIKSIDACQWARVIKSSGASGIILTCKHHDGFCLWNSKYTDFSVKNSGFDGDIVKSVSDACAEYGLKFGVYLSPWDMHDKRYGTDAYNDYFCDQLTELLTGYGEIFEVWFDGAKGREAVDFEYDWDRYYRLIRTLQPKANIAVCGPDIRWVGNEGGKSRKSEYSVVPAALCDTEKTMSKSQQSEDQAQNLKKYSSTDEDLGSRDILAGESDICWYPAEVDVSIRKGWFYSKNENMTVKSPKKLFKIYLTSVGNNCTLLLNVPPTDKGIIHRKDAASLKKFGAMIRSITASPLCEVNPGMLTENDRYIDCDFKGVSRLRYAVFKEDIRFSQRVEAFDLYIKKADGSFKKVYASTVIGACKIIPLNEKCVGARLVIRQSRSTPVLKSIGYYK